MGRPQRCPHSIPCAQLRGGTPWLRAVGSEAGIIPSWRMAPPRSRGQRNRGGWVLWCSPGDASSHCTGVSLSFGCRFGFWDRFSECYLGKGVPSCLEVTKINSRSDRENEWLYWFNQKHFWEEEEGKCPSHRQFLSQCGSLPAEREKVLTKFTGYFVQPQ